ncbi:peptidase S8/S53 domain-containing protein [Lipomyces arxii]|uniref:peptidase S8/S53 domain-containing protein n=1 Tax=Lipomyces arxii TaxID=56418 RepID=UPI0034CD0647
MRFGTLCLLAMPLISAASGTYLIQLLPNHNISQYIDEHPSIRTKVLRTYSIGKFRAIAVNCDDSFVSTVKVEPIVENVSPDITLSASEMVTQSGAPRHLARVSQREKLGSPPFEFKYDNSSVQVDAYVLDTGIYKEHPDFGGRAIVGADFTGEGFGDVNGHGTHVAGLIGSATYGAARNAQLIEVKVLGSTGGGSLSNVIAGLDYAVQSQTGRNVSSVLNLSLGSVYNSILNSAIEAVVEAGLAVVVAAGNDGLPACVFSPASAPQALTVGAIDDADDSIAPFSNWGSCVDVFASGVQVESLYNSGNGTIAYSGTSMASPIAAGVVAYFMGLGDTPTAAVDRVKSDATRGSIGWLQIIFRPFTPNKIAYNGGGLPL